MAYSCIGVLVVLCGTAATSIRLGYLPGPQDSDYNLAAIQMALDTAQSKGLLQTHNFS